MTMGGGIFPVVFCRASEHEQNRSWIASMRFATPGYFADARIPLRRGRDLRETDRHARSPSSPSSAAVRAAELPPGRIRRPAVRVRLFSERTIVGVVGDVRVRGPERVGEPQVYLPSTQLEDGVVFPFFTPKDLAIRSDDTPRRHLPDLPPDLVRTADPTAHSQDRNHGAIVKSQTRVPHCSGACVLVGVRRDCPAARGLGIHGLLAFSRAQPAPRNRRAHGARRPIGHHRRHGAQAGSGLALAGIIPGIAIAYAAGSALQSLLAGVQPGDPATWVVAITLCVLMTLAGSFMPVVRAVRIAPAESMRVD